MRESPNCAVAELIDLSDGFADSPLRPHSLAYFRLPAVKATENNPFVTAHRISFP